MSADIDRHVSLNNELIRNLRNEFGMSETIATMVLSELSAWCGNHYRRALVISSTDVKEAKKEEILRDFNGANHESILHRHGISRATLYRILGG